MTQIISNTMVTKEKNELRAVYDNAKTYHKNIATTWKQNFLTDNEYQSFIKTYSFVASDDVPMKYHKKIEILRNLIANQARIVRELQNTQNNLFTNQNLLK